MAAAAFPVYAVDPQLVERAWVSSSVYGSEQDGAMGVTISHVLDASDTIAVITVSSSRQTDDNADAVQRARDGLRALLHEHEFEAQATSERSQPARDLPVQQRHGQATTAAAQADQTTVDMPVGNSTIHFALVRDGSAWCAAGVIGEINLTVSGRDHDPSSLRLLDVDSVRRLRGPSPE